MKANFSSPAQFPAEFFPASNLAPSAGRFKKSRLCGKPRAITVRFADLSELARVRTLFRCAIILTFDELRFGDGERLSCEEAYRYTRSKFARTFPFGFRSLARWRRDHHDFGLDGLAEQKLGRCGRRKIKFL